MTSVKYSNVDLQMPPSGKLAVHEIQDIKTWIDMGAPDPRSVDTVAALKAKKAMDWDKARDFWSLRALTKPEVPEQIDSFVHDHSPEAYHNVVDRLLASQEYGERWGRHWLDTE